MLPDLTTSSFLRWPTPGTRWFDSRSKSKAASINQDGQMELEPFVLVPGGKILVMGKVRKSVFAKRPKHDKRLTKVPYLTDLPVMHTCHGAPWLTSSDPSCAMLAVVE